MAPNVAAFPNEILVAILGHFCLHCTREHNYDAPDGHFRPRVTGGGQEAGSPSWCSHDYSRVLHSICLVSRRFRSVAQPLLYHTFLSGYGDSSRSDTFSWDRRLSAFLRTIVRRQDLAASVKRIYVHPYLLPYISPEEACTALSDAAHILDNLDVAKYTAQARSTLKQYDWSHTDALELLGVVLALVPNLDRLSLQVTPSDNAVSASAFQMVASAVPGRRLMLRLKMLDICCRSEGVTLFDLDHHANGILDTLSGLKLDTLNLHMCGRASLRIGEDSLHLRYLRLTQSCLDEKSFQLLLSACAPGLEILVYEASYARWRGGSRCGFTESTHRDTFRPTDHILRHLVKFRATLKSMHLDLRKRLSAMHWWEGGLTKPLTGADTLTVFKALEDVFISACSICSAQEPTTADTGLLMRLLPPNIRTLKLAGDKLDGATSRLAMRCVILQARLLETIVNSVRWSVSDAMCAWRQSSMKWQYRSYLLRQGEYFSKCNQVLHSEHPMGYLAS